MAPVRFLVVLGVGYLALLGYIWYDALSNGWAWGWALVGTINATVAALLVLGFTWLVHRIRSRG